MLGRLSAGLVIALVSMTSAVQDASAAETKQAKATHKVVAKSTAKHAKRRIAHRGKGSYLIPPPPPYAPSILPELAYARARGYKKKAVEATVPDKEADSRTYHEKVGVQSVDGYEEPEPVKQNKYVTYWNKS